jgi:hypothetical protein
MKREPIQNFEATFKRRQAAGVEKPRKQTNLSFAAHLAETQSKKYDRSPFQTHLKVKP